MIGIHDDEGMVDHMDTLFLHRGDKVVMTIHFPPQQGRQQPYQTRPGNLAAFMPPASVSGNRQIHLAYLCRLPVLHRRNLSIKLNMLEQRIKVHLLYQPSSDQRFTGSTGWLRCSPPE